MNMHEAYYRDRLYPLQDSVLSRFAAIATPFYLTGGTALSREYLGHRYSDDLDFFSNDHPEFSAAAEHCLSGIRTMFDDVDIGTITPSFVRFFIHENDLELKVDLVNDVPWHSGDILQGKLYPAIDNPLNILSNKISALPREEAKDIADIIFTARAFPFNWMEIIAEAKKKDLWVDELDVSRMIASAPLDALETLRWVAVPDWRRMERDMHTIAKDIALGSDNSLFPRGENQPP